MLAPLGLFFVSVVEWPEDDAWPSGVATLVYMTALMGLSTRELMMVAEGRLRRGRVAVRGESWFAIGAMSVTSIVVTLYYGARLIALCPGTYTRAVAVYQGLSEAVAKAARRGDPMPTLSAGVAKAEPGITLDEWVGRADRALLEAKRRGRAQVVVHDGTEDKESLTASGTR